MAKRDRTVSESSVVWGNQTSFYRESIPQRLSLQLSPQCSTWSQLGTISDRASQVLQESTTSRENAANEIDVFPELNVKWQGWISKRSEWLRRWEKYYFVLVGCTLERFASKEKYIDGCEHSPVGNGKRTLYYVKNVRDAKVRQYSFTVVTAQGKEILMSVQSNVEKVVWMRMLLEGMEVVPDILPSALGIEEFYAMFVVLYTAYSGEWRNEGDMAVSLPPPNEFVFSRFFGLLRSNVILTSNYPPSVPFAGTYRGVDGFLRYVLAFAKHTKWSKFKVEGMSVEGRIAVASGREELENILDSRKFFQNWVHKFAFTEQGTISKIEINGDVVAASAVYKVPGAATTLKLPQDYDELEPGKSIDGVFTIKLLKGKELKVGSIIKKVPQDPYVSITLDNGDKPNIPTTSTNANLIVPKITRRFSGKGTGLLRSSSEGVAKANCQHFVCTNVPRSYDAEQNPVWDAVINLPFAKVSRHCWLTIAVKEKSKLPDSSTGYAIINVVQFISASMNKSPASSESQWYCLSNSKGEYCGKVCMGISCKLGTTEEQSMNRTESLTESGHRRRRNSQPVKWHQSFHRADSRANAAQDRPRSSTTVEEPQTRRRGWSNVNLSPKKASLRNNDNTSNGESHSFSVCGAPFVIPKYYNLIKVCGRGAYGTVIAATNSKTNKNIAIKKVLECIWHPHQLKQILREVRFMRKLKHENILSLIDLLPPPSYQDFRDVYMVVDLMEMDLHRIIYSKEILSDDHIKYFLYQMLSGLNNMHAAGVLHRDLKPSNLLVNSDCQLKICDFGLARRKEFDDLGMTEYVVTRWYRAPELLLGSAYDASVDLWAAGCIFGEMLGRKPLLPGRSYVHQLQLIMNLLGVPEEHTFKENPQAQKLKGRQLLSRTPSMSGIDVATMFPNANPEALDLLWKMLVFDSTNRISVADALRHPYLSDYYNEEKESQIVAEFEGFDFSDLANSDLKELMFKEICYFHPEQMELRAKQLADAPPEEQLPQGWIKRASRSNPGKYYYSNPTTGESTWTKPT